MRSRNLYLVSYYRSSKNSLRKPGNLQDQQYEILDKKWPSGDEHFYLFIKVFFSPLYVFHILSQISLFITLFPCKITFCNIKHPEEILKKFKLQYFTKFGSLHPINSILDKNRQFERQVAVTITFVSILAKILYKSDKK